MTDHHDLTGKYAVHPFAFVQATDPALDAANQVTAHKAWIDTSVGNALKIRNASNTAWTTVLSGGGGVSMQFISRSPFIFTLVEFPGGNDQATFTNISYI